MTKSVDVSGPAWWIYVATLERGNDAHFLYGCAARTIKADITWPGEERVKPLGYDAVLRMRERTVSEDDMTRLRAALLDDDVTLDAVLGLAFAPTRIAHVREVLQDGLGHSSSQTRVHYTLPDVDNLFGHNGDLFAATLGALEADVNLPFESDHAPRVGTFEVFDLSDWLDGPRPISIEVVQNEQAPRAPPEAAAIQRTVALARDEHMAHLVGRAAGDVIVDRLLRLPAGEISVKVEVLEVLDSVEVHLFDASGERLIHHETTHFFNRMGLVTAVAGHSLVIDDKLSRNAKKGGNALHQKASLVGSYSPERSMIGAPKPGSWRAFADDMRERVAAQLPKPSEDRWFPRGVEGEVESFAYLARLLDGGKIHSAILADPWFGADPVRRFLPRLGSRRVELTIVTSWAKEDPDTGEALATKAPTEELAIALREVSHLLNPSVRLINVVNGGEQAFHDRYLVLAPHEGAPKVFMLSNSMNRRAEKWPFCMSLIAPDITGDVRRYAEGLTDGRDVARGRPLQITFRWPRDEP